MIRCSQLHSKIKTVGGCDSDGDCGSILEDGTVIKNAHQPVAGALPTGIACSQVRQ